MLYENIQQALDKITNNFSKDELEKLLKENQGFLCAKFRPEFSESLNDAIYSLDEDGIDNVMSAIDNFWIFILNQHIRYAHAVLKNTDAMFITLNDQQLKIVTDKLKALGYY